MSRVQLALNVDDLDEAIALADRVCVLTARPATIKSQYAIDLQLLGGIWILQTFPSVVFATAPDLPHCGNSAADTTTFL